MIHTARELIKNEDTYVLGEEEEEEEEENEFSKGDGKVEKSSQNEKKDWKKNLLLPSFDGTAVVWLEARIPVLDRRKKGETFQNSNNLMWGALATVQTICEYVFRKHKLFTYVSIPCKICFQYAIIYILGLASS